MLVSLGMALDMHTIAKPTQLTLIWHWEISTTSTKSSNIHLDLCVFITETRQIYSLGSQTSVPATALTSCYIKPSSYHYHSL